MKNTFTMQKYIAVALATAMIGSMGVTAFAAPAAVSPVKAANTRMSSDTSSAKEKLEAAKAELAAAQKDFDDAVKAVTKEQIKTDLGTSNKSKYPAALVNAYDTWQAALANGGSGSGSEADLEKLQKAVSDAQAEVDRIQGLLTAENAKPAGTDTTALKNEMDSAEQAYNQANAAGPKNTDTINTLNGQLQAANNNLTAAQQALADAGNTDPDGTLQQAIDDAQAEVNRIQGLLDAENAKKTAEEIVALETTYNEKKQAYDDAVAANAGAKDPAKIAQLTKDLEAANKTLKDAQDALAAAQPKTRAVARAADPSSLEAEFNRVLDNNLEAAQKAYVEINNPALKTAITTAQDKVEKAEEALDSALSSTEDYDVKDIRLGSKETYKYDGHYYVAYPLEIKDGTYRFNITDNGTGGTVDYDDVEDIDDLKLTVKVTDGSEYVKDYYIDEIESDDDDLDGLYAVILELKDNNTTKKQRIKGTITIKNKTKKLDDLDFSYNYEVQTAKPDDIDGVGDCEFDGEDVYINLVDFNEDYKVADFKKEVENIELEDNNGFYFEVKASDQGKVNLSYDNVAVKSVARRAPSDADLTFYNFYGYPEFDFTGRVTITPEDDYADEYYLYYIDKNDNLKLVNTKLNDDGDALEFKTRTLGRYVLSDMELDTDKDDDYDDDDVTGEPTGPVEDPSMPGGTTGGKYNPATGL